jgi:hypothetical protein
MPIRVCMKRLTDFLTASTAAVAGTVNGVAKVHRQRSDEFKLTEAGQRAYALRSQVHTAAYTAAETAKATVNQVAADAAAVRQEARRNVVKAKAASRRPSEPETPVSEHATPVTEPVTPEDKAPATVQDIVDGVKTALKAEVENLQNDEELQAQVVEVKTQVKKAATRARKTSTTVAKKASTATQKAADDVKKSASAGRRKADNDTAGEDA